MSKTFSHLCLNRMYDICTYNRCLLDLVVGYSVRIYGFVCVHPFHIQNINKYVRYWNWKRAQKLSSHIFEYLINAITY